jgi:hypothetical protein
MKTVRARAMALAALLALVPWPLDHPAAAPADDLRKSLEKIDRQLCARFQKLSCRRNSAKPKLQVKKEQPETNEEKKQPETPALSTNPKKQDDSPAAKVATVPATSAKRPIPVLKPANLRSKKKPLASHETQPPENAASGKIDLPQSASQPPAKTAQLPKPSAARPKQLPPAVNIMPDDALSGAACIAALRTVGAEFTAPTTAVAFGPCSVAEPIKLRSVDTGDGRVKFPDQPMLTCGFAARLSSWLVEKGEPEVRRVTGSRILALGTGPGYQCRGRNGDGSGKLSEHAFGNAVDIEYFKLADGQVIKVEEAAAAGSKHNYLLAALRATGCQSFTTVLGPGANSSHASHLHFDLERRGKNGNHKLCQ